MKKSDINVSLPGEGGDISLHLQLDDNRSIIAAWGEADEKAEHKHMMDWLCPWLAGRDMPYAFENVAEAFIKEFPHLPWTWSQMPQELVRQALYQSHPHIQVDKDDPIVCKCHKVRESSLKQALQENPHSNAQGLGLLTKAGTGCGSCRPKLLSLIERYKPEARRWNGFSNAEWVVKVQDSLHVWQDRTLLPWMKEKKLVVTSFKAGKVTLKVEGGLTADQEWELNEVLSLYWEEGFSVDLALFLDFELV